GRALQDGHLLRRRRCLHLRRAHRGALRLARLQPAGAVRDLQQPRVERGEARGTEPRARGPRREDRPDADLRSRSGPRLRAGLPRLRRPRREGGGSGGVARRAGARAQGRSRREAPGAPERHLQEARYNERVRTRRILLLLTAWLSFDLATPLPGAFEFEIQDSEVAHSIKT